MKPRLFTPLALIIFAWPVLSHAQTPRCENLFRSQAEVRAEGEFMAALSRWKTNPPPTRATVARTSTTPKNETQHADFDFNFRTSVLRSIPRAPRPGTADVYFTDSNGRQLPSLTEESGYRFNNVIALSDVLYAVEVAKGSPRGQEGEVTFFDYDPATSSFHRLIEFQGFEREQAQAAAIFRDPRNRSTAQAVVLESGLLEITTQTHKLRVETPEAMQNEFGGGLWIQPNHASDVTRIRVIETSIEANRDPVFLRVVPASKATIGLHSMEGDLLRSWDTPEFGRLVRAFIAQDGYIVQFKNTDGLSESAFLLRENGRVEKLNESDSRLVHLKRKMGPLAWAPPSSEK